MSLHSPMAAKDAKARRMSMQEFKYIQSRGDAADYRAGRYVPAYHGYRFTNDEANEKWSYDHALKPIEQWAVHNGYAQNPFDDIRKSTSQLRTGSPFTSATAPDVCAARWTRLAMRLRLEQSKCSTAKSTYSLDKSLYCIYFRKG